MPTAIFSIYNTEGLAPFMEGLAEQSWDMYGNDSTQKVYKDHTGRDLPSLGKFVEKQFNLSLTDEDYIYHNVAAALLMKKTVSLACINLRPIQQKVITDFNGLSLLYTARHYPPVITNPDSYSEVLEVIKSGSMWETQLLAKLDKQKEEHINQHYAGEIAIRDSQEIPS